MARFLNKLAAAALLLGATVCMSATAFASAPAGRPNVLFIVVDDLSPAFEQCKDLFRWLLVGW